MTLWQLILWALTNEQGGFFSKIGGFFKKIAKPVLKIGGGILGGLFGGAPGAAAGSGLGGALGGLLAGGGAAAGGVLAGREQAKRLRAIQQLLQPLGGEAAAPLFRQAADVAANQAIAAGFGRSGAQVIGTRQALNKIILRDLVSRRALAGAALGVPGAVETGITAGGNVLGQLGGLLDGGTTGTPTRKKSVRTKVTTGSPIATFQSILAASPTFT